MLINIGVNLTHKSFKPDLEAILDRSFEANVEVMVVTGTNQKSSQQAQQLAAQHTGYLFSTAVFTPIMPRNAPRKPSQPIGNWPADPKW